MPSAIESAPNATEFTVADKGTRVDVILKVGVDGNDWYKISYDGKVGYAPAAYLMLGGYDPGIRPDVNASLKADAVIYDLDGGSYEASGVVLAKGTKVEVIGLFDSNTEYTKIKYYDSDNGGTRTCYVLTRTLDYAYMKPEQKIAMILIPVIGITILVVVFIAYKITKRKKEGR